MGGTKMEQEIMVSVSCLVYNHAKYLRKCLDGFVMQKTNFKFEVLIHDDASTDGSQDIIREYEKKYPDIIKPIYQTENQYSKHISIGKTYQYPRLKGKYIAFCEGDDYWCDDHKLQKQFDIMEMNSDCSMCVHRVQDVSECGELLNKFRPSDEPILNKFDLNEYLEFISNGKFHPFQTSSYFIRREVSEKINIEAPEYAKISKVGDVVVILTSLTMGKMYYFSDVLSNYRKFSVGSWSAILKKSNDNIANNEKNLIDVLELFNEYTKFEYDDLLNEIILSKKLSVYILTERYKLLFEKSNRKLLKKLSYKERLFYFLMAYFPRFMSKYLKFKGR